MFPIISQIVLLHQTNGPQSCNYEISLNDISWTTGPIQIISQLK